MASATWEEIILAEAIHDYGSRDVPLLNYTLTFALKQKKITENLSQGSRVFRHYSLRRFGRLFRDSLGWPAKQQSTSVTCG
jgi:hypothetical protein